MKAIRLDAHTVILLSEPTRAHNRCPSGMRTPEGHFVREAAHMGRRFGRPGGHTHALETGADGPGRSHAPADIHAAERFVRHRSHPTRNIPWAPLCHVRPALRVRPRSPKHRSGDQSANGIHFAGEASILPTTCKCASARRGDCNAVRCSPEVGLLQQRNRWMQRTERPRDGAVGRLPAERFGHPKESLRQLSKVVCGA